jgi:cystathionine beta-lyase/cystathionine gamma-synthase
VPDDLLRLSIGIEAPGDLITDLEAALEKGAPR